MAGPTLILNTTQFGHADLLDELEAGANEVFYKYSKNQNEYGRKTKAKELYLDFVFYFIRSIISDYTILQG